jgi:hypothetical protein
MAMQFSVATWNLERPPVRSTKLSAILSRIDTVAADVWVLTESRTSLKPVDGYQGINSPAHSPRLNDPERWVSIWSRWPIRSASIRQSFWSATALVDTEFGRVVVHGVVLPYRNEKNPDGGRLRIWDEFSKELMLQGDDWAALRREYPGVPLVLAGDFNQNLDRQRWYGNADTRRALGVALKGADLSCLTAADMVESGKLKQNHLVDHICVSADLRGNVEVDCWEPVNGDGVRMSDHPGVVARLSATGAR